MSLKTNSSKSITSPSDAPLFPMPAIPRMSYQKLVGGSHHAWLYPAGATHMMDFCQPLGVTAYKIGITGNRDPQDRVEDLRRKRYGSLLLTPEQAAAVQSCEQKCSNSMPAALTSANEWFLIPLKAEWLSGIPIPTGIALRDNALRITVPAGISTEALDTAVHGILRPRSLRNYLQTDEGRERMMSVGRNPDSWLYTSYSLMTRQHRISAAKEIYLFRPRRELAELITALGALLKRLRDGPG